MTLISRLEEKHCFIACSDEKVKTGLCDCINKMQNQALNIPDVVGKSEQCEHDYQPCKHEAVSEFDECTKCGKIN